MPRSVASFDAVGWPVIPYPVDFRIDPRTGLRPGFSLLDGLAATTLAGKEWAGLLGYRMMGWTRELLPAPADRAPVSHATIRYNPLSALTAEKTLHTTNRVTPHQ
jgi:hypothetical protein